MPRKCKRVDVDIMSLKDYKEAKISILKDFGIELLPEQLIHIRDCETEIQVDNYVLDLQRAYFELDDVRRPVPKFRKGMKRHKPMVL